MTTDKELLEKRIRTEAEIIVANARKKGVVLDLELVVECLKSRVKFDRSMMSFLVKLQAAGKDCNDYLRDLKAERERRPLDEIKKAKNLARLVKNTDLPPVVVPSFKLGWGSSQAIDPGGA